MSDGRSVWSRIQEPTATIGARILRCGPEMAGKGMKDSEKEEEAKNEIAVEAMILVRHPNSTAVRCDLKSRQIAIPRRAISSPIFLGPSSAFQSSTHRTCKSPDATVH